MKKIIGIIGVVLFVASASVRAIELDSIIIMNQGKENVEKTDKKEFDRGLRAKTFMPKGAVSLGGAIAYTSLDAADYQFLLFDDLNASTKMMSGRINFMYAFADNIAAGVQFEYSRNNIIIDNVDMSLSEDLSFAVSDYYAIQQIFSGAAFLRTYINIGNSKILGLFNDVKVYFAGGQGKVTSGPAGDNLVGTYEKITKMGLVLAPGVTVFTADFMAIEASVGILGVEYNRTEQTTNQVYQGSYESVNASFKLNLLSLGLGLAFYF